MATTLADTVAVVTGASRGIGKGIALALGHAGATVYLTGRTTSPQDSPWPGTITGTACEVTRLGGHGIRVPVRNCHQPQTVWEEPASQERSARISGGHPPGDNLNLTTCRDNIKLSAWRR